MTRPFSMKRHCPIRTGKAVKWCKQCSRKHARNKPCQFKYVES